MSYYPIHVSVLSCILMLSLSGIHGWHPRGSNSTGYGQGAFLWYTSSCGQQGIAQHVLIYSDHIPFSWEIVLPPVQVQKVSELSFYLVGFAHWEKQTH